jgi:uncharacterized repeat protein (TIGR03803 family)
MRTLNLWKPMHFVCVLCAVEAISSPAQSFTTLVNFDKTNGATPVYMSPVQGTNGNLYGTASNGGAHKDGTVFEVTPGGTLATLYSFCSNSGCTDGSFPYAGLVLAKNGNFYGTTYEGGKYNSGTVFEITPGGTLTTLHSFNVTDGAAPRAGLVQASNGNFYGTTAEGGAHGDGTAFEINPAGKLTTLLSFDGTDGDSPYAGLVQAINGNLYGTTYVGGAHGKGTVFEMTPTGKLTTLYSFCSQSDCTDGSYPYAGLIQASNGNLYGTTSSAHNLEGTVFKITPGGTLTVLHSFTGTDGARPDTGLVLATNGNFYGTTYEGGAYGYGTVFEITAGGALTVLHSFNGFDGTQPDTSLVQGTNGNFYGTTVAGGTHDYGTAFSLAVGLGPFVETNPTSGAVGTAVIILGNNLMGATRVAFNATAASFKVVSSTEITAAVPKSATTGLVEVKTTSAILSSNVSFRVR